MRYLCTKTTNILVSLCLQDSNSQNFTSLLLEYVIPTPVAPV